MSDVDIIAIQQQAEEIARAEYKEAWNNLEKERREIQDRNVRWRDLIERFDNSKVKDGEVQDLDIVVKNLTEAVIELEKLKKMFKLINENELLSSQWNRIVASIRLVGGDTV